MLTLFLDEVEIIHCIFLFLLRILHLKNCRIRVGFQGVHQDLFAALWRVFLQVPFAITLVACEPQMKVPHHTQEHDD